MACDAMCIPYREILTSGTAMLAMSHGRPVLSLIAAIHDAISPECGILIEPGDRGGAGRGAARAAKSMLGGSGDLAQAEHSPSAKRRQLHCLSGPLQRPRRRKALLDRERRQFSLRGLRPALHDLARGQSNLSASLQAALRVQQRKARDFAGRHLLPLDHAEQV